MWVQGFSPALELPFKVLTFLGNEGFFLLLLPLVYWCIDRPTGARLTILFLLSAYLNAAAKTLADQPRPFQHDSRIKPLVRAEGGGLPSGHTQHAVTVWGYLALRIGKVWSWAAAILLMIFVPLSRIYLGVHFPTDLLGGYLIGALLLFLFWRLGPAVEVWLTGKGMASQLVLALIVAGVLLLIVPGGDRTGLSAGAALLGTSMGFVLERRLVDFDSGGPWWKRVVRFVLGIAVSIAIWAGLKECFSSLEPEAFFRFVRYGLLGLWAALGAPWVFKTVGLVTGQVPQTR